MRKVLLIISCLLLVACGKSKDVLKDISKEIENSKSYYLDGVLEVVNGEDSNYYNVNVSYKEGNLFKVSLVNQINNYEQIILRNSDGVYVLTPSLNKSFKFQSDWPYNNSQAYLLQTLLSDIKNNDYEFLENENGYTFTTNVNYSNDKSLVKQDINFDTGLKIKSVFVYDSENNVKMKMVFNSVDMGKQFDNNYFALSENMSTNDVSVTSKLNDVIYPMYVPSDTYLTNQETINTDSGKRIILTFTGNKPFTFVQEDVNITDVTILVDGEFVLLNDCIGNVTEKSVSWISNGIEYYIASDVLDTNEMVNIAKSVGLLAVSK